MAMDWERNTRLSTEGNAMVAAVSALGRLLMALIFVRAGINKLGTIAATTAAMRSHGIPYPDVLVWGAILVELGGGLMLVAGLYARWVALALFFTPYHSHSFSMLIGLSPMLRRPVPTHRFSSVTFP